LRSEEFFKKYSISVKLGVTVTSLDTENRFVNTDKGVFEYHVLLIATGGPARTFRAPEPFVIRGAELGNIFVLREGVHAQAVHSAIAGKVAAASDGVKPQVVIVGSSFIGMEAASYLIKLKTVDVTVIGMEKVVLVFVPVTFLVSLPSRFLVTGTV
jgi:apoptosis-inducing factor 3